MPHNARQFSTLPDRDRAPALLEELAAADCPYAPVPPDRPLALYGAGDLGRLARDFLKTVGHDIALAIDSNARSIAGRPEWSGVRLVPPDKATTADKTGSRIAVSVVTNAYVPIERALLDRGFTDVIPFYDLAESFRDQHPLSNGWFAAPLTAEDEAKTLTVLGNWGDDVSRAHHLQFLAWRRLREEWSFEPAPLPAGSRYFIPEIARALHSDEILLDAGAHHGSVVRTFLKHTRGEFRQIIAIEPDAFNRSRLVDTLHGLLPDDGRVQVFDFALADREGEAPFRDGLDYASQLSGTGRTMAVTRTIDALEVAPSFIKLHLEGAELAALKGARRTLLDYRPIITATVYHTGDGIWRTAAWLMEALADYSFLFRNHSWCGTGSVIYAIPNERIA